MEHTLVDRNNVLNDRQVHSHKKFFIEGTEKYPGIVHKSELIWWYRKKKPTFAPDTISDKRLLFYDDLFDTCVREDYIEIVPSSNGTGIPIKGKRFGEMYGLAKLLHNAYNDLSGFWKIVGWSLAMLIFITGITGQDVMDYVRIKYKESKQDNSPTQNIQEVLSPR